jgi:hypothetical protein
MTPANNISTAARIPRLRIFSRYFRAEWSGIKSRIRLMAEIADEMRWQRDVPRIDSHSQFVGQWVSYNPKAQGAWPDKPAVVAEILERSANVETLRKPKGARA